VSDKHDKIKDEVWKHFKDYQVIYLTTVEGNQPRVRPVTLLYFDNKFWITTGTDNAKVRQIKANPKMEFCLLIEEQKKQGYIRATGTAKVIMDREIRENIAKNCDFFSSYFKSHDDPHYTLLEMQLADIEYLRPDEMYAQKFRL
jgi:general stress protein 26